MEWCVDNGKKSEDKRRRAERTLARAPPRLSLLKIPAPRSCCSAVGGGAAAWVLAPKRDTEAPGGQPVVLRRRACLTIAGSPPAAASSSSSRTDGSAERGPKGYCLPREPKGTVGLVGAVAFGGDAKK